MKQVRISPEKTKAALATVAAVASAIQELGTVPSGHLYARLMSHLSLEEYNRLIGCLKSAGLVSENFHELKWIGPIIEAKREVI